MPKRYNKSQIRGYKAKKQRAISIRYKWDWEENEIYIIFSSLSGGDVI